jgi:hypothetical protein
MLRSALHESGAFTLINREDMEAIAQNHQIELVFCDDDACLLRVGSLLGAQKLVAGEIGLVIDEFVVNARLVDIGSEALVNERVASRRSGQSALALQRAMAELAADLSGQPSAPSMPAAERGTAPDVDAVILAVEKDRVLVDSGRWEGMKNGTILEVLNSRSVDSGDSSVVDGGNDRRRAIGRIQIVDVFGSHSAATCVGQLRMRDLQVGDPVRKFRVPRWLSLEPHLEYLYAPQTVKLDFTSNTYSTGANPQLILSTHHAPEINIAGAGFGGTVTVMPWRRVHFSLFGTVDWAYTVDGTYTTTQFSFPDVTTGRYGVNQQNFVRYGVSSRIGLLSTRRLDMFIEPFGAMIDWNGLDSEIGSGVVIDLPDAFAGARLGLRLYESDRITFVLSSEFSKMFGGDWSVSAASIRLAPSLSL